MKLNIGELKEVQTRKGVMIRFDLTIAADDGEPLWTSQGWRMDDMRKIYPPASKTKYGRLKSFHTISARFTAMLHAALESFPFIKELLGVPPVENIPLPKREELAGTKEVLTAETYERRD